MKVKVIKKKKEEDLEEDLEEDQEEVEQEEKIEVGSDQDYIG